MGLKGTPILNCERWLPTVTLFGCKQHGLSGEWSSLGSFHTDRNRRESGRMTGTFKSE